MSQNIPEHLQEFFGERREILMPQRWRYGIEVYRTISLNNDDELLFVLSEGDLDDIVTVLKKRGDMRSPYLAKLNEIGCLSDERGYWISKLELGSSFHQIMRESRSRPQRLVSYIQQVAEGLRLVHQGSNFHGDIRPSTIYVKNMLGEDVAFSIGFALDFWIAPPESADLSHLELAQYLVPERSLGEDLTPSMDVYALGVLLYRSVFGHHMFDTTDPSSLASAHARLNPTEPANPCHPHLWEVMTASLEKKAENRLNIDEFVKELSPYVLGEQSIFEARSKEEAPKVTTSFSEEPSTQGTISENQNINIEEKPSNETPEESQTLEDKHWRPLETEDQELKLESELGLEGKIHSFEEEFSKQEQILHKKVSFPFEDVSEEPSLPFVAESVEASSAFDLTDRITEATDFQQQSLSTEKTDAEKGSSYETATVEEKESPTGISVVEANEVLVQNDPAVHLADVGDSPAVDPDNESMDTIEQSSEDVKTVPKLPQVLLAQTHSKPEAHSEQSFEESSSGLLDLSASVEMSEDKTAVPVAVYVKPSDKPMEVTVLGPDDASSDTGPAQRNPKSFYEPPKRNFESSVSKTSPLSADMVNESSEHTLPNIRASFNEQSESGQVPIAIDDKTNPAVSREKPVLDLDELAPVKQDDSEDISAEISIKATKVQSNYLNMFLNVLIGFVGMYILVYVCSILVLSLW
ncbi:MAG: hypothetical protein CMK59_14240 [Proteobacteria bacterium]|nr:hypothetical protein [Pseudomonadota bacterium]